jgi:hypothetical protein
MNCYDKLYKLILNIDKNEIVYIYTKLCTEYEPKIVKFIFYELYDYEIDEKKYKKQLIRIHQDKFREDLIQLYKKCVMSNVSHFQACHIIPFPKSNIENKYNKYNGILLKADLHELFDDYIFSINPETYTVQFNNVFFKDEPNKQEYQRFDNKILNLANDIQLKKNLQIHYDIFLSKNKN